jgi:hypothetical protein
MPVPNKWRDFGSTSADCSLSFHMLARLHRRLSFVCHLLQWLRGTWELRGHLGLVHLRRARSAKYTGAASACAIGNRSRRCGTKSVPSMKCLRQRVCPAPGVCCDGRSNVRLMPALGIYSYPSSTVICCAGAGKATPVLLTLGDRDDRVPLEDVQLAVRLLNQHKGAGQLVPRPLAPVSSGCFCTSRPAASSYVYQCARNAV